jgi:hypothetical protein
MQLANFLKFMPYEILFWKSKEDVTYYKNNWGLIKKQIFENHVVFHIISLNMASTLLGTIQYNYGYSGFDNSFNNRVCSGIYCATISKKEFHHNMISRSSICKGQTIL